MIYNLDKINELAEGDKDFIVSVVSVFLEEVPEDLYNLENAIAEKNYEQIYKMAHKIKPNVDLLGMQEAREVAFEIETLGKNDGSLETIQKSFPSLQNDIKQVIIELQKDFEVDTK